MTYVVFPHDIDGQPQAPAPILKSIPPYFLLTLLLLVQCIANAHVLSGYIKDQQTKEALPGVTIFLDDLKTGVTTDSAGFYQFKDLKEGIYLIEISFIGYKKLVERISIQRDTTRDFLISPAVSELNDVVVTAVSRATELKLSPVIIKPVDAASLRQTAATNLIDALRNVPGINQITTGAGISKPTIRGLGYNRVLSLFNGVRQEGQQWGDEHGIEIDEYAIDRIEIVKGPGSLLYGSDAIAGVLNYMPPHAPEANSISSQVVANYQSNNHLIGYSVANSGNKRGIQWLGRFSNKLAGNYRNQYDGTVYNSGYQEYDGSLFLGLNRHWGFSHLYASSFNTKLNMVEGERDSLGQFIYQKPDGFGGVEEVPTTQQDLRGYRIGTPHQQVNHFRLQSNNFFILQNGTLNLDLGYQSNKRREYGDVLQANKPQLYFDLNTVNYSLRYNLPARNKWELSFGLNGYAQENKNRGVEFIIPSYKLLDVGAFVFAQKQIGKWSLVAGFRGDNRFLHAERLALNDLGLPANQADSSVNVKFPGFANNYSGFSGSLGVSFQINKTSTLKFNVSRGFRAPNIAELSSNGKHEGTLRYEYGNANLKSEVSHQVDVAYYLNTDHVTFELTPFSNFISNYIFSEKIANASGGDSIPDPADPTPAYLFNQGNAMLYGGESYLDIHPHPFDWFHIAQSFNYVRAVQSDQPDSSRNLPFTPAPRYRFELKAQFQKVSKAINRAYFTFAVDHFFRQHRFFSAYRTETETPAYTLLSAGLGFYIPANKRPDFLNVILSADNLSDIAYQSHLSRLKYAPVNPATGRMGIFNMGRNVSIKLILNL